MGFRRLSRECAIEILYQLSFQKEEQLFVLDVLNDYWSVKKLKKFSERVLEDLQEFTGLLVKGVLRHSQFLDDHIMEHSNERTLHQIGTIDRSILKTALFEMFYLDKIPCEVSINEAIEVAKRYGSQESHHFVNALLDSIYKKAIEK